ncbi:MAG: hypothetical protein FJ109_06285 [Deltaproteobacteria bacterium]|nr:hypothetical protein [Deltaproteobacteria bacterium]
MKTQTWTMMAAAALVVLGLGNEARADSTSLLTMGLGSSVGLSHVVPVTGGSVNDVVSELNVRIKMLKVLGFDFNYNMAGENPVGHGEIYASSLRASALLYLVPTRVVSVYLAAGTGSSEFTDMLKASASKRSYHGGGGMELYIGRHLALSTEFLMLVPQVDRVVVSSQPLKVDGNGSLDLSSLKTPTVKDYISADNFQVTFGLKWFF